MVTDSDDVRFVRSFQPAKARLLTSFDRGEPARDAAGRYFDAFLDRAT